MRHPTELPPTRHSGALAHIPALDGLRGAAVAAVVLYHLGLSWAGGGFLGVSAFFTLSGFLICSLLLHEHAASGRIDLRRFWARRARRLLPAGLLTLFTVVVVSAALGPPGQGRTLRGDVVAAVAHVANWRFLDTGADYGALWESPSAVQHFWSLAVEEQFYAIFPVAVVILFAVAARFRLDAGLVLGGVLAAGIAASTAVAGAHAGAGASLRSYYGTDTRAAEILVGALLAVVVFRRHQRGRVLVDVRLSRAWQGASVAIAAALLSGWVLVDQHSGALHRGGLLLHAAAVAALIALVLRPGPVARLLSLSPLRALGRVSYAVYLFHWPIFLWLTPQRIGVGGLGLTALRLAVTVGAALVSHVVLEAPIRSGRALRPLQARVAGIGAIVAVMVAASLTATVPPADMSTFASGGGLLAPEQRVDQTGGPGRPHPSARLTDSGATPSVAPTRENGSPSESEPLPAPGERVRVYVGGDSVSYIVGLALRRWAEERDDVEVWVSGHLACHVVRGGTYRYAGVPKATEEECNGWEQIRSAQVREARPHVSLLIFGAFDVLDRQLPGETEWQHVGQRRYDDIARREIAAMTDLLRGEGTRVAWATYPAYRSGLKDGVLPASPFPEWDPARMSRWNELLAEVIAERPGTALIDWRSYEQRLPGGELDLVRRPDGLHHTDAAADAIAAWLAPQLLALVPSGGGT